VAIICKDFKDMSVSVGHAIEGIHQWRVSFSSIGLFDHERWMQWVQSIAEQSRAEQ
jgi:hypothetical protein